MCTNGKKHDIYIYIYFFSIEKTLMYQVQQIENFSHSGQGNYFFITFTNANLYMLTGELNFELSNVAKERTTCHFWQFLFGLLELANFFV